MTIHIKRRTKLYPHQIKELKFHLARNRSASWDEMGVGKTLIALEKIRILYNQGLVRNILVICPLSVLETWATEITKHTTFTYTKLVGSLEDKVKALASNTQIFLISYDSITGRKKTLGILFHFLLNKYFGAVILDEITHVKNFNAIRTRAVTLLCNKIGRVLALSGTPITNDIGSVLTIYNCMDGGETFGQNYFVARNHFFENRGYSFPDWHLRKATEEEFKKRLFLNAVRLLKTDCLDLPPKIFTERYAELEGTQKNVYKKIADELLQTLRLPEGVVRIKNSLVKMTKLSQLADSFLYTDKGTQLFPNNPKLELLRQTIEEIPSDDKIIILSRWTQDINDISKLLNELHIPFVTMQGNTHDRTTPIKDFNDPSKARILLAQITVGAYGLNLTCAHTVIYYSLSFSLIEWLQSQDRIHRIGQTKPCIYIPLLVHNTIDEYIYQSLKDNIDIAKSLLDERLVKRLKENLCL